MKRLDKHKLFFTMSIAIMLCSCTYSKDKNNTPNLFWTFNSFDRDNFHNPKNNSHTFSVLPTYQSLVVIPGNKKLQARFCGVDIHSGQIKFDIPHFLKNNLYITEPLIKNGFWYFSDRDSLYRINLENGSKVAFNTGSGYFLSNSIYSVQDYLVIRSEYSEKIYYQKMSELGSLKCIPEVHHQTKHTFLNADKYYFFYGNPMPFVNNQSDILVLLPFEDVDSNDRTSPTARISLYNITQNKFEFDGIETLAETNKEIESNVSLEDRVLLKVMTGSANNALSQKLYLCCLNRNTGKIIWKIEESMNTPTWERQIINDKVYCLLSSGNGLVYSLVDGKKLFGFEAHGGGVMQAKEDVVYFVSSDYKLRAIDAHTGKTLTVIESPLGKPFDLFATSIGIVDNKIIVHNYKNAYCYEAIR